MEEGEERIRSCNNRNATRDLPALVLDGENVRLALKKEYRKCQWEGLEIALRYLHSNGWTKDSLFVIFPSWQRQNLEKEGDDLRSLAEVLFAPGDAEEDDDKFAISTARELNGYLITNDKSRNHIKRWTDKYGKKGDELREWCRDHLFPFGFAGNRFVPHLEVLLKAQLHHSSSKIVCYRCRTCLAIESDIVSSKDPAGIYETDVEVNPAGFEFMFVKVRAARNVQEFCHDTLEIVRGVGVTIKQESPPRMQDSWYPDYYSWCLLFCSNCEQSLGWHFRLERSSTIKQRLFDLLLPEFYGLRHDAIVLQDPSLMMEVEVEKEKEKEETEKKKKGRRRNRNRNRKRKKRNASSSPGGEKSI